MPEQSVLRIPGQYVELIHNGNRFRALRVANLVSIDQWNPGLADWQPAGSGRILSNRLVDCTATLGPELADTLEEILTRNQTQKRKA